MSTKYGPSTTKEMFLKEMGLVRYSGINHTTTQNASSSSAFPFFPPRHHLWRHYWYYHHDDDYRHGPTPSAARPTWRGWCRCTRTCGGKVWTSPPCSWAAAQLAKPMRARWAEPDHRSPSAKLWLLVLTCWRFYFTAEQFIEILSQSQFEQVQYPNHRTYIFFL